MLILGHHKTATQWVIAVMGRLCGETGRRFAATHRSEEGLDILRQYDSYFIANASYDHLVSFSGRAVHILRNPLDMIVSGYYSHLHSHSVVGWPELERHRSDLSNVGKEPGLWLETAFLLSRNFQIVNGKTESIGPLAALERWNWDDPRFLNVRMEDLTKNPHVWFERMFKFVGERVPRELDSCIDACAFEKMSGGRLPGIRDEKSHYRSGLPHEWRSELPPGMVAALRQKFCDIISRFYPEVIQ